MSSENETCEVCGNYCPSDQVICDYCAEHGGDYVEESSDE